MVDDVHEPEDDAAADKTYHQGFASIDRSIAIAAARAPNPGQVWDAQLTAWRVGLHEALVYWHGIARNDVLDGLYRIAESHDLTDHFSVDAIQQILAEEVELFTKLPQQQDNPEPPKSNGGYQGTGQSQDIGQVPVIFPFPLNGNAIPRRPWIVPGLLLRRHVTLLVAPPGSGKSLLTLQIGMVCADGATEWGGWRPRGSFRVLMINSEEDKDEMDRRLFAAGGHMKFNQSSNLAYAAQPETIVIAKADYRTKTVTRTPVMEQIIATIQHYRFDIVIIDPFAETFAGDENDNSEMKWAGVLWREVARRTNTAVLLVHHAKKYSSQMAGDMDSSRGGGSLIGVARFVCTLFGMTPQEAERMSIDPEKRNRYLRFDDAKANITLVTNKAKWFEKLTVTLPNTGEDGEPADEVGVLVPWRPTSAFDKMNEPQAIGILDELATGYRDDDGKLTGDPFAPNPENRGHLPLRWAGFVITRHLQCSESDARDILAAWVKEGVVSVVYQPVKSGKKKGKDTPSPCLHVVESMRPGRKLDEARL